ncbi:MAG: ATPase, T2SS/T4P/T4SS family [Haloferacaceae archaeon]
MAIDDADGSEADDLSGGRSSAAGRRQRTDEPARRGEYTWTEFVEEYAESGVDSDDADPLERSGLDPEEYLGFAPNELPARLAIAHDVAGSLDRLTQSAMDVSERRVAKDRWTWADYERVYQGDEAVDRTGALGFDPERIESVLASGARHAEAVDGVVDRRTVSVDEAFDEDAFFTTARGGTTIVNRYDLEKTVSQEKKHHFEEVNRYWVNKPYAFVIIFQSVKENEHKYYAVQPYTNPIEEDLVEFLTGKLQTAIKYSEVSGVDEGMDRREEVIEDETYTLLERYDLYSRASGRGLLDALASQLGVEEETGTAARLLGSLGWEGPSEDSAGLGHIPVRPEPAILEQDPDTLSQYQVEKLLYYLKRDFVGYERIDPIKHDINVEDISCDGYNSPVFVYHSDHEQIITNIYHGEEELDDFVVKLAQRSGKGISKRRPQVDATLPDGSRAQLTLGREVSGHGTNYTIRQFKDVPFTPVDLINWKTFSLEEMAYLWLCIENNKSLVFAGGTASGKTTSLNAVSLFIPSKSKIVSIEDTREVELPQRNWIASVTRPSFSEDGKGDIDEFDLLEAALRQRPEYIVMGEVRGEEGRTLFQIMSTGHTTLTTFHADSVGEVLKRFTTDPINVSKTMFTALNLVSIQASTRVEGSKVRRNKNITEINFYDAENDEINVQDVYQWQAETDEFLKMSASNTLDQIRFDRGWSRERLDQELFRRKVILAYLIEQGLNTYTEVAATLQAFINDEETILTLVANDKLEESLEDLREMESVLIDIDPEKEEMVPRPDPTEEILEECEEVLERAEAEVLDDFRGEELQTVESALTSVETEPDVVAETGRSDSSLLSDIDTGEAAAPDDAASGASDVATDQSAEETVEFSDPTELFTDSAEDDEAVDVEAEDPYEGGEASGDRADGDDESTDGADDETWLFGDAEREEE